MVTTKVTTNWLHHFFNMAKMNHFNTKYKHLSFFENTMFCYKMSQAKLELSVFIEHKGWSIFIIIIFIRADICLTPIFANYEWFRYWTFVFILTKYYIIIFFSSYSLVSSSNHISMLIAFFLSTLLNSFVASMPHKN